MRLKDVHLLRLYGVQDIGLDKRGRIMSRYTLGVIQMDSQDNKEENLKAIVDLIELAVEKGAKLVSMPESVNYIGLDNAKNAEIIPEGKTFNLLAEEAVKHNIWLHCGSIYEISEDVNRPYNTTMVINPKGELVAKYSKIHPFDVIIDNGPSVRESDTISPGKEIVTVDTGEVGHLGLSICYDMRFGELYRLMALQGAEILFVPANFTLQTGKDHWMPILRTRAIENGCYVVAAGQYGIKPSFQAYGKSLIIDPWGNIISMASDRTDVITAEIDLDYVKQVRKQLGTLDNRRTDIYSLKIMNKN